jgi:hypothetical protein
VLFLKAVGDGFMEKKKPIKDFNSFSIELKRLRHLKYSAIPILESDIVVS